MRITKCTYCNMLPAVENGVCRLCLNEPEIKWHTHSPTFQDALDYMTKPLYGETNLNLLDLLVKTLAEIKEVNEPAYHDVVNHLASTGDLKNARVFEALQSIPVMLARAY